MSARAVVRAFRALRDEAASEPITLPSEASFIPCERQIPYWGMDGGYVWDQPWLTWDADRGCYALLQHAVCIACRGKQRDNCPVCRGEYVEIEGVDDEPEGYLAGQPVERDDDDDDEPAPGELRD